MEAHPDSMTTAERDAEVMALLARGVVRAAEAAKAAAPASITIAATADLNAPSMEPSVCPGDRAVTGARDGEHA